MQIIKEKDGSTATVSNQQNKGKGKTAATVMYKNRHKDVAIAQIPIRRFNVPECHLSLKHKI